MDTKQLVAFCAVVERRSFSQAADQLGVTQPAVSLQIRSLEQRVGQRLLDRSGQQGRADRGRAQALPRSAAAARARGAQLLAGPRRGTAFGGRAQPPAGSEIGASTRAHGGSVLPGLLGEFQLVHPLVHVALTVSDTHTVVEQVGRRELELGVVGAGGRHRGVSFEPFSPRRGRARRPRAATSAPARA